jgi:glucokinase
VSAVVGIDLGGTKVAVAALGERGLGEVLVRPTELSGADALLEQLVEVARAASPELEAVGIGVPSVVEFDSGRVVSSVNIPLVDVPLRQVLGERLGVPVFVDNDATVAALAEAHDERLQMTARNLVMLTIGTGVGGGIVLAGRIYRGATGGAGELGHTLIGVPLGEGASSGEGVPPAGERFPQPGSLEWAASGHALDRLAQEAAAQAPDSTLGRARADGRAIVGADAVAAAQTGDPVAARVVEIWAERVGVGVANAINTFEPEEVVIGGGAARAGEALLGPALRIARGYVVPGLGAHTRVRLARHENAGVLGAALLARHELDQPGGTR